MYIHSQKKKKNTTFVEVFDSLDVLNGGVFSKNGPFVLQVQYLMLLLSLCFLGVNTYIAASFVLIKIWFIQKTKEIYLGQCWMRAITWKVWM